MNEKKKPKSADAHRQTSPEKAEENQPQVMDDLDEFIDEDEDPDDPDTGFNRNMRNPRA